MDIFLSWSGDRSQMVAHALREWLPLVLDNANPWLSSREIPSGARWSLEVGESLERTNFGILCLTKENREAPWLLFEAGALSKSLAEGAVCPYLFDLGIRELDGPLSQFQSKKAEKGATLEMILDFNSKLSTPGDGNLLTRRFTKFWPDLEAALKKIPRDPPQKSKSPARDEPEILEELVTRLRSMDSRFKKLEYEIAQIRTAANDMPATKAPRPRRNYDEHAVNATVQVEMHDTKIPEGESIDLTVSDRDEIQEVVAATAGLDLADYMVDWILEDQATGEPLVMGEYFLKGQPEHVPLRLVLKDF